MTGEVQTTTIGNLFVHSFSVAAPTLNYRYELFRVQHPAAFYPLVLAQGQATTQVKSEEEFKGKLKEVFSSQPTLNVVPLYPGASSVVDRHPAKIKIPTPRPKEGLEWGTRVPRLARVDGPVKKRSTRFRFGLKNGLRTTWRGGSSTQLGFGLGPVFGGMVAVAVTGLVDLIGAAANFLV